jgi:transposase
MITERGVPVKDLSDRLGVSTWSLYQWVKHYAVPPEQRKEQDD